VVIPDYKNRESAIAGRFDERLQLSIYSNAAREKWGIKPITWFSTILEGTPVVYPAHRFSMNERQGRGKEVAANIARRKS